jgi:type IV pilus assembly protein PilY1
MSNISRKIALSIAAAAAVLAVPAFAALTDLSNQPLVVRNPVTPNVLFALSVEFPTANTAAYSSGTYSATNEYLGIFDAGKCYVYDSANTWFVPTGMATSRQCAGKWSGNFLNWGTMTGLDAFRIGITGGNRSVDTATDTVIDRAIQSGQGGTSNFPDKTYTNAGATAIPFAGTLMLSSAGNGVQATMTQTGSAMVATNASMTFAQTNVSAVSISFKNTTGSNMNGTAGYYLQLSPGLSNVTISGATGVYTSATGIVVLTGLATTLVRNATGDITVGYTSPLSTSAVVDAHLLRSGTTVGTTTITLGGSPQRFSIRAKVCMSNVGLEANCQQYGSSFKPVGVVQQNGTKMRFGVFSYYNSNDTNNAIMVSRLKSTAPQMSTSSGMVANPRTEWSSTDGSFLDNPDAPESSSSNVSFNSSGVVNYINKFGRSGGYKTYDDVGILYYAALSYLRNRPADTQYYTSATTTTADNFPVIKASGWDDPIVAACQANYIILLGDNHTWCDKKLPGGTFTAGSTTAPCAADYGSLNNGDPINVSTLANTIASNENPVVTGGLATKPVANYSSMYLASLAYWGRTQDIRPDDNTKPQTLGTQRVKTFIINVQESGDLGVNSQFWYAAKYGGFDDLGGNVLPTTFSSWAVNDPQFAGSNAGNPGYPTTGYRPRNLLSASDPKSMIAGINTALTSISAQTDAAAASATSSPNITPSDNSIYSSTYRTNYWDGEVIAQTINASTGNVNSGINWSAGAQVNSQSDSLAAGTTTARKLYTFDTASAAVDRKKALTYTGLTVTEQSWFTNHCTNDFLQCSDGTVTLAAWRANADSGQNLLNFLTGFNTPTAFGSYGYLDIFRSNRLNRLGDTVDATPLYVSKPTNKFTVTGTAETFLSYVARVSSRPAVLYVAANDGFLHAFRGDSGVEMFAYAPRQTLKDLYKIADKAYSTNHEYFVDGSPVSMDVYDAVHSKWKTMLVGGLGRGGQGYYALDVSDPTAPQALWETCSDTARCALNIPNMGYSYGNPVITRLPTTRVGGTASGAALAGRWVALLSSGYNNVTTTGATGKGELYVVDVLTGALLDTYSTGVGSLAAPSGLSKLSTFAPTYVTDAISNLVYGADLQGNVWRFDLALDGSASGAVTKIVTLKDAGGTPQPVMSKIEVASVPQQNTVPLIFVGTGQYLGTSDFANTGTQSIYAIKDPFSGGSVGLTSARDANMVSQTISDLAVSGNTVRQVTQNSVDWQVKNGWYADFPDTGERVAIDPQINLGTLLVSTNVVNSTLANACQIGGYSYQYQFDYKTGSFIGSSPNSQVAIKYNSALVVGTVVIRLPSGALKILTTTAQGSQYTTGLAVNGSGSAGRKISWREIAQ